MATNTYDAIVVGSGITGGWAAKELTEKGLNTLVLEAGRSIVPEQDYVEHVPIYDLKYRGWDDRAERQALCDVLNRHSDNLSIAARVLGISRPTFYRLLHKHQIR